METANGLLVLILFLGLINIFFNRIINKTILSASFCFWLAWFLLMLGSISFINNDLMNSFSQIEIDTFYTFFVWCFWGFLFGTVFSYRSFNNNNTTIFKLTAFSEYIIKNYFNKALNIVLLTGTIFFITRLNQVELSSSFFAEVRDIYNEREFNFFQWLGTHFIVIVYFLLILLGVRDAKTGFKINLLLKTILFASPLFLANGTRTFLISPFLYYVVSFLLVRGSLKKRLFNSKELIIFSTLLFSSLLLFSFIGYSRGGYGNTFNLYLPIIGWPVSTTQEFYNWLDASMSSEPTNGFLTFGWFASLFDNLQLLSFEYEKNQFNNILEGFIASNNATAFVPRSIIPDLIFDFGYNNLAISSFILAFAIQFVSNILKSKSIISHTISVVLLISAFMTIQNSIFSPGTVVLIFWSVIFNFLIRNKFKSK